MLFACPLRRIPFYVYILIRILPVHDAVSQNKWISTSAFLCSFNSNSVVHFHANILSFRLKLSNIKLNVFKCPWLMIVKLYKFSLIKLEVHLNDENIYRFFISQINILAEPVLLSSGYLFLFQLCVQFYTLEGNSASFMFHTQAIFPSSKTAHFYSTKSILNITLTMFSD